MGSGNSLFHCSFDEANPNGSKITNNTNGDVANIVFSNARLDLNFAGANNPSFSMKIENDCHDSVYRGVSAYDGARADLFTYNGNIWSQLHVNSDASNSGPPLSSSITWTTAGTYPNWPLAGVADYGVYIIDNSSLAQTQCDIASNACVKIGLQSGTGNPGQISDTQMKCGALMSVPTSYYGVEIASSATQETIQGTASSGRCGIPPAQLIHVDKSLDPTVSICNNSNGFSSICAGGQAGFAAGEYYTQIPGAPTGGQSLTGALIYAMPFIGPVTGSATQLSFYVTTPPAANTTCSLGIYNSVGGAPGTLYVDSGTFAVSKTFTGVKTVSGLNFYIKAGTPYFLVVGCLGTLSAGGMTITPATTNLINLIGGTNSPTAGPTSTAYYTGSYTSPLPANFGTVSPQTGGFIPSVWISP